MNLKKHTKKKGKNLKNFEFSLKKNLKIDKIKINPFEVIEDTKNKIGNFYQNLKKQKIKEKKLLERKREAEIKKELEIQKKEAQKKR